MSKDKSFAAKLAKAAGDSGTHCPECGELLHTARVVENTKDETKGSYKFKESYVSVCKCNQSQVYDN